MLMAPQWAFSHRSDNVAEVFGTGSIVHPFENR